MLRFQPTGDAPALPPAGDRPPTPTPATRSRRAQWLCLLILAGMIVGGWFWVRPTRDVAQSWSEGLAALEQGDLESTPEAAWTLMERDSGRDRATVLLAGGDLP